MKNDRALDRALDWAELALMHKLIPFTLDDFALLVDTATERRFTKADRRHLGVLAGPLGDADYLIIFWANLDLMGGTDA